MLKWPLRTSSTSDKQIITKMWTWSQIADLEKIRQNHGPRENYLLEPEPSRILTAAGALLKFAREPEPGRSCSGFDAGSGVRQKVSLFPNNTFQKL